MIRLLACPGAAVLPSRVSYRPCHRLAFPRCVMREISLSSSRHLFLTCLCVLLHFGQVTL